jgi:prepilin-type N-terminal cleavage/methylation domain-containing protein
MKNNSRLKTSFDKAQDRQTQNSDSKLHSGMTLIEIIVTIAILVIALTIIGSLLVSIIKAQTRTNASRTVQQEARNVMETIAREAKLVDGSDQYSALIINNVGEDRDTQRNSGNQLHLTKGNNDEKVFQLKNNAVRVDGNNITSDQVNVTELTFKTSNESYYDPSDYDPANPTDYSWLPDIQPFVSIILTLQSKRVPEVEVTLKTTVSSRDYKYER